MAVTEVWDAHGNLLSRTDDDPNGYEATIRAQAAAAIAKNNAAIAIDQTAIATASPSNAQVVAFVKMLAQRDIDLSLQANALIRLALQQFDSA